MSRSRRLVWKCLPSSTHHVWEKALPPGMDLLLPGASDGLARALAEYQLDLLVVYGFNWKLQASVLGTHRFGVVNVHTSLLPRYRGPAPVLWAIRNGDPEIGVTVHRMDERFDMARFTQCGGIPLDEDVTPQLLWQRIRPVLRGPAHRCPGYGRESESRHTPERFRRIVGGVYRAGVLGGGLVAIGA